MRAPLPSSVTNFYVNLSAVCLFFFIIYAFKVAGTSLEPIPVAIIAMFGAFLLIAVHDRFVRRVQYFPSSFLDVSNPGPANTHRVAVKYLGLIGAYVFVGFFYWLFPEYNGSFYDRFYSVLKYAIPFLMVSGWFYFSYMDKRMLYPEDGYWHLGLFLTGRFSEANKKKIAELLRVWTVKGFFLPLMFTYIVQNVTYLMGFSISSMQSFESFFNYSNSIIYTIDVMFAAIGYVMTLRILDAHIRSVEPTMLGWVVCIMCYEPFWSAVFYGYYFAYNDNISWWQMTAGMPLFQYLWGMSILILTLIYSLATVSLGYRFSNLTYRGLVTNGPYRWSKHPAYICKNLSWWLISVPFIVGGEPDMTIRHCILLLGVNFIYFMRARTEERHLSHYPEFVEYANMMNERGVFSWLGKAFPFFSYREAKLKEKHPMILEPQ